MQLRVGDRVRWTRDDPASGLVDGQEGAVGASENAGVRFRLEDGSATELADGDSQLRRPDRARASAVRALRGRAARHVSAAAETGDSRGATQESVCAAIGRALPMTHKLET